MTSFVNTPTTETTTVPLLEDKTKAKEVPEALYGKLGNAAAYAELVEMLTYKRPAFHKIEAKFIKRFLIPLGIEMDSFGNIFKRIGTAPVLWSSHVDTVHTNGGFLAVGWDEHEIGVSAKDSSNCLGADDTAGVWLMVQMIRAKRPGLYVFHRCEENGGKGSAFILKREQAAPDKLAGIKFAIALDRREKDSVITHQRGMRCCSDTFGNSLADQLGMGFKLDTGGSFTDTANYTDIIGECTNISVGYRNAHAHLERLDLNFIFKLRDSLLKLDWTKLIESRKPGEKEYKSYSYQYNNTYNNNYRNSDWRITKEGYWAEGEWHPPEWGFKPSSFTPINAYHPGWTYKNGMWFPPNEDTSDAAKAARRLASQAGHTKKASDKRLERRKEAEAAFAKLADDGAKQPDDDDDTPLTESQLEGMVQLVKYNPDVVADILEQHGYGPRELHDEIMEAVGLVQLK